MVQPSSDGLTMSKAQHAHAPAWRSWSARLIDGDSQIQVANCFQASAFWCFASRLRFLFCL